MDCRYDRIPNVWILIGISLGLLLRTWGSGWYGVFDAVFPMILSFCLLFPIYRIGGLGAGDVKLFLMIGSFVSVRWLLYLIGCSFIIGAVFSVGKILLEKNFRERAHYFFSYLLDVLQKGQWRLYGEDLLSDGKEYKSNKIHFALPIFISVVLGLGGLF